MEWTPSDRVLDDRTVARNKEIEGSPAIKQSYKWGKMYKTGGLKFGTKIFNNKKVIYECEFI